MRELLNATTFLWPVPRSTHAASLDFARCRGAKVEKPLLKTMRRLKRVIEWVVTLSLGVLALYKVWRCKHSLWAYQPIDNGNVIARCWYCGYGTVITAREFAEVVTRK